MSLCLQTAAWGSPQDTPPPHLLVPVNSFDPQLWSLSSSAEAPTPPDPRPRPPGCGRPQWGLLTAQRALSATTQQLGQFGEENKHFLPVLGLAARQPASSGFLGLLGWERGGSRNLRGAKGRHFPTTLGGRGQGQSGQAPLSGSLREVQGHAHHAQAHLHGLAFPGLHPGCHSHLGVPVWVSFASRMGFLSGGQHSLPGLRAEASASCLATLRVPK